MGNGYLTIFSQAQVEHSCEQVWRVPFSYVGCGLLTQLIHLFGSIREELPHVHRHALYHRQQRYQVY